MALRHRAFALFLGFDSVWYFNALSDDLARAPLILRRQTVSYLRHIRAAHRGHLPLPDCLSAISSSFRRFDVVTLDRGQVRIGVATLPSTSPPENTVQRHKEASHALARRMNYPRRAHVDDIQYLRVLMRQLRRKLETHAGSAPLLVTEPGGGYRLLGLPSA